MWPGLGNLGAICEPRSSSAQVDEQNTLTLRGCWPAERNGALLRFAYTNPEAHFKTQVLSLLKKHNITLKGSVVQSSVSAIETNLIMALRGEPLTHLLEDVIQMSDNVVADNLFRQYVYCYSNPAMRTGQELVYF